MSRSTITYSLAALAVLIGGTTTTWLVLRNTPTPEWKVRLLQQPTTDLPATGRQSAKHAQRMNYLSNDLRRREHWGEAEVSEILEMLHGSPLEFTGADANGTQEQEEAYLLSFFSQASIRTRLGIGAPIDPAQRERLIDAMLERSHAAAPLIRESLAEAFCWSGLIFEDERVDRRVREMMNDPEPMVAANARNQYRFHSEGREKWAEYQRRQGRDIPSSDG